MWDKIEKFQLLLLAVIFALGGICATCMIVKSISNNSVTVTGSYSQNVTSDSGLLEFEIRSRKANKTLSYDVINKQRPVVINYLKKQGFKDENIEIKTITSYPVYEVTSSGMSTNRLEAYDAAQKISVRSNDVQKIKKVSNDISELTSDGIDINVFEPEYFYSKLSDLKVTMLEEASKDAKQRAAAMLKPTHNKVGQVKSVKMGVFQVTPVDSTNVSDYGINDTSSIEKKVTSVANVIFSIK